MRNLSTQRNKTQPRPPATYDHDGRASAINEDAHQSDAELVSPESLEPEESTEEEEEEEDAEA